MGFTYQFLSVFIVYYGLILPLASHEATCQDLLMTFDPFSIYLHPSVAHASMTRPYCHDAPLPFEMPAAAFLPLC